MRANQSSQAYSLLRERIMSGALAPGQVVSEAALAREMGVSRTPVGEALRRLSHEGLVDQIPRYGTVVREFTAEDLHELFEVREALEAMAVSRAALRISAEVIEELTALCDAIDAEVASATAAGVDAIEGEALRRFLAADMAFHLLIIAAANNRRLSQIMEQTHTLSSMFHARRGVHSVARIKGANQAHREIVAALADRDAELATDLLAKHIRRSCEQSIREPVQQPAAVTLGSLNLPPSVMRDLKTVKP